MSARLAHRLLALLLALTAGTAAAAPPCLGLVLSAEASAVAEAEQGCEDDCCDEDACAPDCSDCPCCPFRAPATFSAPGLGAPAVMAVLLDRAAAPPLTTREPEGVFRPPRTPHELS